MGRNSELPSATQILESELVTEVDEIARVSADPSQTWRYGRIMTGAFVVLSPLLALGAAAADVVQGLRETAAFGVAVLLLGAAYAFGMGVLWSFRPARVEYLVDQEGLKVTRGGEVIYAIAHERISSFHMVGKMDIRECLLVGQAPPPSWPYGIVEVMETSGRRAFSNKLLPEIMLWGSAEALAAEWQIQQALRSLGPLNY